MIAIMLCATCSPVRVVLAQDVGFEEYRVKAAFLYNAMKFVQWPVESVSDAPARLKFCVVGVDPFGEHLDGALADRQVQGRALVFERLAPGTEAAEMVGCNLLFLGASENGRAAGLLDTLSGAPVLTVAEWDGFAAASGVLELQIVDGKLAFVVNQAAAEARRLRISSQLLKLAKNVHR